MPRHDDPVSKIIVTEVLIRGGRDLLFQDVKIRDSISFNSSVSSLTHGYEEENFLAIILSPAGLPPMKEELCGLTIN